MKRMYLIFTFFLLITLSFGCTAKNSNSHTDVLINAENTEVMYGTITINDVITLDYEDKDFINDFKEVLKQDPVAYNYEDGMKIVLTISGEEYIIMENFLKHQSKYYSLSSSSTSLFSDALYFVSKNVDKVNIDKEYLAENVKIELKDINNQLLINELTYEYIQDKLKAAKIKPITQIMIHPYPLIQVNINGFNIKLFNDNLAEISIDKYHLDYYLFDSQELWNVLNMNYPQYLERKGLFQNENIEFSFDGKTFYEMNNDIGRVDLLFRCFNQNGTVIYKDKVNNENQKKITIILENQDKIDIYENDIMLLNGEYLYNKGIYQRVNFNLNAN